MVPTTCHAGFVDIGAPLGATTISEIQRILIRQSHLSKRPPDRDASASGARISTYVARVDVKCDHLAVHIANTTEQQIGEKIETDVSNGHDDSDGSENRTVQAGASANVLRIPWKKIAANRPREIMPPASVSASPRDKRPIRAGTRANLIASIAKGRRWLEEWTVGTVTSAEQIAARENCTIRQVNMTISLAFLAPALVQAAVEGHLPRGIGVANLRDASAEWARQHAMLGLSM
jgi:hypothetical protein